VRNRMIAKLYNNNNNKMFFNTKNNKDNNNDNNINKIDANRKIMYIFYTSSAEIFAENLKEYFKVLNIVCYLFNTSITSEHIEKCKKNKNLYFFIIGPQYILNQINKREKFVIPYKKFFLFQIEQLNNSNVSKINSIDNIKYLLYDCCECYDYSEVNLKYYPEDFKNKVVLVKPFISKMYNCECNIADKCYDILFIGALNERRKKILNDLNESGFNLKVESSLYGEKLKDTLAKTKIVLNLHYYDNCILEIFRIHDVIPYNCKIISEIPGNSEENYLTNKYKNIVSFVPVIDESLKNISILKDKIEELLTDDKIVDYRKNNLFYRNINNKFIENISLNPVFKRRCKTGVVITTHGFNGVFVRNAIQAFIDNMPNNTLIILYVNESDDKITLDLKNIFPQIIFEYIEDQTKNGGLTATWNSGIKKCKEYGCDTILLSNDDIIFNESIKHIINECQIYDGNELRYYGPVSNNPGPTNKMQYKIESEEIDSFVCGHNLNGFFMVFSLNVLESNKYDELNYFDPSYPFGGNEVEWFDRFKKKGGIPIVVPRTFVYHYKLKSWRKNSNKILKDKCIYTINTNGYEGNSINIEYNDEYDSLYFTDDFNLFKECIKQKIIPFLCKKTNNNLHQREIKSSPHLYLPHIYNSSIYIDGNCKLNPINWQKKFEKEIQNYDMICFTHPTRNTIKQEMKVVYSYKLATKESIMKINEIIERSEYKDDKGLTETNVLIRNHKNITNFNEEWNEMIKICRRDQLSFDYLLEIFKVKVLKLPYSNKPVISRRHVNPLYRTI